MKAYMSRALWEHFPHIFNTIESKLLEKGIKCETLPCENLWIRDYMPVHTDGKLIKFQYKMTSAMERGKFSQLHVPTDIWAPFNAKVVDYALDGGNVVQNDEHVFITEMVFKRNPMYSQPDLKQFLKDIFFPKKIIYLPVEPGDDLGHADGLIKFKNEKTVIINDYSKTKTMPKMPKVSKALKKCWKEYSGKLEKVLASNGFMVLKMPWAYAQCPKLSEAAFREKYPFADEKNEGYGYYINYYQVDDTIFCPQFGIKDDMSTRIFLSHYFPGYDIVGVDCADLSMLGGLINCVTWEN